MTWGIWFALWAVTLLAAVTAWAILTAEDWPPDGKE